MKRLTFGLTLWALFVWVGAVGAQTELDPLKPPVAKKAPQRAVVHGDVRIDDYY